MRCFFYILLLLTSTVGFSANSELDSITNFEKKYQLCKSNNKADSTLYFAKLLITRYLEQQDTAKVATIYYEASEYLLNQGQFKLASSFLDSYIEFAESTKKKIILAKSYHLTGAFFVLSEINIQVAQQYYNKSLKILMSIENKTFIVWHYLTVGDFYENNLNEIDKAVKYYKLGLEISIENNNHYLIYTFNKQLAEIYRHKFKNYDSSMFYYNKCLQLAKEKNDTSKLIDSFVEIGCISVQYNKLDSVLNLYNYALNLAKQSCSKSLQDFCYNHLSIYYDSVGNYKNALYYLKETNINRIYHKGNYMPQPLLKMAEYEQKLGNHRQANVYYERYIRLNDSLNNITKADITSKLELKFEFENIEKENMLKEEKSKAALQRQKTIRNYLILLAIFLILLSFLFYKNQINKKNTIKKLHEADKMKLRFFTNISHEIRTPLTILISPLERLCTKHSTLANDRLFSSMIQNGNKLKRLINQLLDVSKLEGEKLLLEKGLYSFNTVFRLTTSMFESAAQEKQIEYVITALEKDIVFSFDKERIEHVISNLLSNAFKYTSKGGKVIASATNNDYEVILSIKDTGVGISKEDIKNIFLRFFQSQNDSDNIYGGTGIGLNVVKEYVELHDGTITVKSKPKEGTEFLVNLPLMDIKNDAEVNQEFYMENENIETKSKGIENKKTTPSTKTQKTILIVEDNTDLNKYLVAIFEKNYCVLNSFDGNQAMELAVEKMPDLVISDVMMPDCDGYQLTEKLKSRIETSHIPIILLTAKAGGQSRITGYNYGADDYMEKPFNETQLVLKVRNMLNTLESQKEKNVRKYILTPNQIAAPSLNEQFLLNLVKITELNISNFTFSVEQLCNELAMSRRNVFGKIKTLTNMTPSEFIRTIRLKQAAQLLKQNAGSISDIAYKTGFDSPSYFAKCFKEMYKKTPSEYI